MGLTQAEKAMIEKARAAGGGGLAEALEDSACAYLMWVIAKDLSLKLKGLPSGTPRFFTEDPSSLRLAEASFDELLAAAVELDRDVVTYFVCLAKLQRVREKYQRILKTQPIPTMDQVGPRGLLQYGGMSPKALTGFLLWRKWMFDIDNRAGQETGYLFEPIIAHSIGGVPESAKHSPIRRHDDPSKGRQVDCIRRKRAYEIKLRVTIAASGQGRWREELDFPIDCKKSGYTPVLIVFDPTPNPKLTELRKAFETQGGETHVGAEAWKHLEQEAGPTMAKFLEKYVRTPLSSMLKEVPAKSDGLPVLRLTMSSSKLKVVLGDESFEMRRQEVPAEGTEEDKLPDDVDDTISGP